MRIPNPRHAAHLTVVRGIPFIQNLRYRKCYVQLRDRDILATPRSDTVFVFGSGYSINDITPQEWAHISQCDTLSFNWFIHQNFVRIDYHLIREICHGDMDPSIWKPKIREYANLIRNNPHYQNTLFLVQQGWKAINGNRMIGMRLLPEGAKIFRYRTHSRGGYAPPSPSFANGLVHGAGTLSDCVNFAYIMGWNHVVLAGIDLYDRRYFWLNSDETRDADLRRGASHKDQHNMKNMLVPYLEKWRVHFQAIGRDLFVYNPRSLLADTLPVYPRIPLSQES